MGRSRRRHRAASAWPTGQPRQARSGGRAVKPEAVLGPEPGCCRPGTIVSVTGDWHFDDGDDDDDASQDDWDICELYGDGWTACGPIVFDMAANDVASAVADDVEVEMTLPEGGSLNSLRSVRLLLPRVLLTAGLAEAAAASAAATWVGQPQRRLPRSAGFKGAEGKGRGCSFIPCRPELAETLSCTSLEPCDDACDCAECGETPGPSVTASLDGRGPCTGAGGAEQGGPGGHQSSGGPGGQCAARNPADVLQLAGRRGAARRRDAGQYREGEGEGSGTCMGKGKGSGSTLCGVAEQAAIKSSSRANGRGSGEHPGEQCAAREPASVPQLAGRSRAARRRAARQRRRGTELSFWGPGAECDGDGNVDPRGVTASLPDCSYCSSESDGSSHEAGPPWARARSRRDSHVFSGKSVRRLFAFARCLRARASTTIGL